MRHVVAIGGAGGRRPAPCRDARSRSCPQTEMRDAARATFPFSASASTRAQTINRLSEFAPSSDRYPTAEFLIKMTALQPERARRLSHAVAVSGHLAKHSVTLERGDAIGQRAAARRALPPCPAVMRGRATCGNSATSSSACSCSTTTRLTPARCAMSCPRRHPEHPRPVHVVLRSEDNSNRVAIWQLVDQSGVTDFHASGERVTRHTAWAGGHAPGARAPFTRPAAGFTVPDCQCCRSCPGFRSGRGSPSSRTPNTDPEPSTGKCERQRRRATRQLSRPRSNPGATAP
jgi:hypothetical protein